MLCGPPSRFGLFRTRTEGPFQLRRNPDACNRSNREIGAVTGERLLLWGRLTELGVKGLRVQNSLIHL